jgi:L-lactate dehydrogenase complex protein LldF
VRIPLPQQLLALRGRLAERGLHPRRRRVALRLAAALLARPGLLRIADRLGRALARALPAAALEALARPWTRQRALPPIPAESFRTRWKKGIRDRGGRPS